MNRRGFLSKALVAPVVAMVAALLPKRGNATQKGMTAWQTDLPAGKEIVISYYTRHNGYDRQSEIVTIDESGRFTTRRGGHNGFAVIVIPFGKPDLRYYRK